MNMILQLMKYSIIILQANDYQKKQTLLKTANSITYILEKIFRIRVKIKFQLRKRIDDGDIKSFKK